MCVAALHARFGGVLLLSLPQREVEVIRAKDASQLILDGVPPFAVIKGEEHTRGEVIEGLKKLAVLQCIHSTSDRCGSSQAQAVANAIAACREAICVKWQAVLLPLCFFAPAAFAHNLTAQREWQRKGMRRYAAERAPPRPAPLTQPHWRRLNWPKRVRARPPMMSCLSLL